MKALNAKDIETLENTSVASAALAATVALGAEGFWACGASSCDIDSACDRVSCGVSCIIDGSCGPVHSLACGAPGITDLPGATAAADLDDPGRETLLALLRAALR